MMALVDLPAPLPGHVRVLRVEHVGNPMKGMSGSGIYDRCLGGFWEDLPQPWDDGTLGGIAEDEVCACTERQLSTWWPDWVHSFLATHGLTMVALDVPNEHARVGHSQTLIKRQEARVAAVLH